MHTHTRFFVVDQFIVPIVINFIINALLARWLFANLLTVPLYGGLQNITLDTLINSFVLPFATSVLTYPLLKWQLKKGKLAPLPMPLTEGVLQKLVVFLAAQSSVLCGVYVGLVTLVLLGLPTIVVLHISGVHALGLQSFMWFKAGYAAVLTALCVSIIVWALLLRASRHGTN